MKLSRNFGKPPQRERTQLGDVSETSSRSCFGYNGKFYCPEKSSTDNQPWCVGIIVQDGRIARDRPHQQTSGASRNSLRYLVRARWVMSPPVG